jgi:hypothetical protein
MVGGHFVGSVVGGDTLHCTALLHPDATTSRQLDWRSGPFIPLPGTVSVGALNTTSLVCFDVADSGAGADPTSRRSEIHFGEFYLGGKFMWTQPVADRVAFPPSVPVAANTRSPATSFASSSSLAHPSITQHSASAHSTSARTSTSTSTASSSSLFSSSDVNTLTSATSSHRFSPERRRLRWQQGRARASPFATFDHPSSLVRALGDAAAYPHSTTPHFYTSDENTRDSTLPSTDVVCSLLRCTGSKGNCTCVDSPQFEVTSMVVLGECLVVVADTFWEQYGTAGDQAGAWFLDTLTGEWERFNEAGPDAVVVMVRRLTRSPFAGEASDDYRCPVHQLVFVGQSGDARGVFAWQDAAGTFIPLVSPSNSTIAFVSDIQQDVTTGRRTYSAMGWGALACGGVCRCGGVHVHVLLCL